MKVVYIGTSDFAATVLEWLVGSQHDVKLVVTQPDRRQGRGRRLRATPVADRAAQLGIEGIKPERVNDANALKVIAAARPDLLGMCAYGQLIGGELLDRYEIFNVHPSLLPRWRGAAPIERAIMAGDRLTGVSIMRIVAALDAGDTCLQRQIEIGDRESAGELAERLARLGGEALVEALDRQERGAVQWISQDDSQVTYAAKVERGDRKLDLCRPAVELDRQVRALHPIIGAYLELKGGDRLGVCVAEAVSDRIKPGEVVVDEGRLLVGCSQGSLELKEIKPAGKRAMVTGAYLAGHGAPELG